MNTVTAAVVPTTETPETSARVLFRARWGGLAGTTVLAVGAWGAGVFPRPDPLRDAPVLRILRDDAGQNISIALAALGMVIWLAAWWSLRSVERSGATPRWLGTTAAWWSLPIALAPPLLSRDVYSYAAQGQVAAHNLNPYEHGPGELASDWMGSTSPTWYDTHAPYGPLFVIAARGAAVLGEHADHLEVAVLALRALAIASVFLLAVYLPRLARGCGMDPSRAQWLALASPLTLVHSVSGSHNDILMVALLVAGLAYLTERKPLLAGALLGAALAVKVPAAVVIPFAALVAGAVGARGSVWRGVGHAAALTGTAFAGLTALTIAGGLGWGWIDAVVSVPGTSVQWTSAPTSWGIAASWLNEPFGLPSADNSGLEATRNVGLGLLICVLLALWLAAAHAAWDWHMAHRATSDTPAAKTTVFNAQIISLAGIALLAMVLLAPAFHPWYLGWPLALLAASVADRRGILALAVASTALCFLVLPDGYNLARCSVAAGTIAMVLASVVVLVFGLRLAVSILGRFPRDRPRANRR